MRIGEVAQFRLARFQAGAFSGWRVFRLARFPLGTMKTILLLVLMACGCVVFAQQATAPIGAWMPVNVKWRHAPPDVAPKLLTASTDVLYFQPDGQMVVIGCIVDSELGRFTTISAGDGQTVAAGDWHEEQGKIVARYRVVFRTVPRIGEELPGPWNQDVLTIKDGQLSLKGVRYRRVPELDKSASEMLPHRAPTPP